MTTPQAAPSDDLLAALDKVPDGAYLFPGWDVARVKAALQARAQTAPSEVDERAMFEAAHRGYDLETFRGNYTNNSVNNVWRGWQARAQAVAPEAAQPVVEVRLDVRSEKAYITTIGDAALEVGDKLYAAPPPVAAPTAAVQTQRQEDASTLDLNESDPVVLWAEIWRLRAAIEGPDGFPTWQDAAVAERVRRVAAEKALAASPPPQAQAQPTAAEQTQRAFAQECNDADELLRMLGLDPERCRTDGGAINLARVRTFLSERKPEPMTPNLPREVRASVAAPPSPVPQWRPIETAPQRQKVIVAYRNLAGMWRRVMATYWPAQTLEAGDDYIDDDGDGWCPAGWYESCEGQETTFPVEHEPTHWMTLPASPSTPTAAPKEMP